MTVLLRRYPAEEMLRLVSLNEELWMPRAAERHKISAYRKVHNWLVREDCFGHLLFRSGSQGLLPGLKAGPASLLWRRIVGTRVRGVCAADAVRVKTNLRAFYPHLSTPTVGKILLGEGLNNRQKLHNEIEARSQVSRFGCVTVPQLLKHDVNNTNPWYTEQLVVGRTSVSSDSSLVADELVPGLMKMYERFGIVWQAPASILAEDWYEALKRAVDHIGWQPHWLPTSEFLDQVLRITRSPAALPCSTGHGDLSPSNLVVTREGSICVIDWEQAGFRPIIFDLAPLMAAFPGIDKAIHTHFAAMLAPSGALSFREQYLLAVAAQIVPWQRHAAKYHISTQPRERLQNRLSQLFDAARHAPERATCARLPASANLQE